MYSSSSDPEITFSSVDIQFFSKGGNSNFILVSTMSLQLLLQWFFLQRAYQSLFISFWIVSLFTFDLFSSCLIYSPKTKNFSFLVKKLVISYEINFGNGLSRFKSIDISNLTKNSNLNEIQNFFSFWIILKFEVWQSKWLELIVWDQTLELMDWVHFYLNYQNKKLLEFWIKPFLSIKNLPSTNLFKYWPPTSNPSWLISIEPSPLTACNIKFC